MVKTGSKTSTAKRRAHVSKTAATSQPTAVAKSETSDKTDRKTTLPSGWKLLTHSLQLLWQHRTLFLGISAVYAVLSLLLVQSLDSSLNVSSLNSLIATGTDRVSKSAITAQWLVGGSGPASAPTSGVFQGILIVVVSLAIIWALRQVAIGARIRIRDAFYRGMYPAVPVLLVALVLVLQLLPALFGLAIYAIILSYNFAANTIEKVIWAVPITGLVLLSLYLIAASTIALYIATLPDMAPIAALKSARKVVRYRRWAVLRKLFFLVISLAIIWGVLVIPPLFIIPVVTPWLVFVLSILSLPVIHAYIYSLYRELLK